MVYSLWEQSAGGYKVTAESVPRGVQKNLRHPSLRCSTTLNACIDMPIPNAIINSSCGSAQAVMTHLGSVCQHPLLMMCLLGISTA